MKLINLISVFIILILNTGSFAQIAHTDWIRDAVIYQIFPERFYNADLSNDPELKSLMGSYPHDTSDWQLSPWTSDWYKLQPWEEKNQKGFAHNAQRRRYGGDLQGIIDKLDYLSDLGINTIYLNPVFHSPSLHKYDAATWHHIDAYFGPNPQADIEIMKNENPLDYDYWPWTNADKLFLSLIQKAHQKNIRIILDGVFNHTGINFFAFIDILEKGQQSAYKDWYTITAWDDPATPESEFAYNGWIGVKELPEIREDKNGLVAPVKEYVLASVTRWMDPDGDGDPSDGIDGWRLDVAEMVDHNFWKIFRSHVKSINKQVYITGEIFWDDWQAYKFMDPAPWLKGDQFDGVMNYRWAAIMSEYFIDNKKKISAGEFVAKLIALDESYQPQTRFQLLNLMDSHDTDRLSSHIVNPDLFYDKMINLNDNPFYDVRKPNDEEWQILKLIVAVQMTFPGAPMIFYGDEAGMWGADDPDERKPMVWPDFTYEIERANISKTARPADTVFFKHDVHTYYKKLIHVREKEPALRRGSIDFISTDDLKDIVMYIREYQGEKILCIINNSNSKHILALKNYYSGLDLITGLIVKLDSFEIAEKTCLIIKLN